MACGKLRRLCCALALSSLLGACTTSEVARDAGDASPTGDTRVGDGPRAAEDPAASNDAGGQVEVAAEAPANMDGGRDSSVDVDADADAAVEAMAGVDTRDTAAETVTVSDAHDAVMDSGT